ncbi:hypothetical protein QBC37DRAFT_447344 [Rhypophila decipiens]|uniref:Flavin-containing monooxygenase n=1 Tax=Rhypophila decipiens TaxID=261697 RepID=A0AAN6Y3Y9_9PEZI|nr:hypothetical protein QBC37DRAFT_447344 [Rhypophila decipiens]
MSSIIHASVAEAQPILAEKLEQLAISEDALPSSPPSTASEDDSNTSSDVSTEPLAEDDTIPPAVEDTGPTSVPQKISSYPQSRITLIDRFIDQPRELRVAVIGGGLSGILAGVMLPAKVPNLNLTIYEKNHDFGGTWLENVYPGVRCDIPSHVYQSTFAPKTDWSDQFAPGAEIRDYWQSVARKYDVYQYARFHHKVTNLGWDTTESAWKVTVTNTQTGETTTEIADFVLTAIGRFNAWKLPDYPGLSDYKGVLRHASNWNSDFDPAGKKVAVIGNGASGIQLVANLQRVVSHLDHYARNKTWIAASWAGDERTLEPQPYTEEQKQLFSTDPEAYLAFRKDLEDKYWRRFSSFFRGSKENLELREKFTDIMRQRLHKKPELLEQLVPDFSPNCRRLTPGPGYLEAISEPNVSYITTPIAKFTETGIQTIDGEHRPVDAIFCATGAIGNMLPPFAIINSQGTDLRDIWDPSKAAADPTTQESSSSHSVVNKGYPYTYLGLATPRYPNLLFLSGPHGTGASGTVPHAVETQLTYFAKLLRKVSREGIATISPSKDATDDFVEYSDAFFSKTVLSDPCSSWYNGGRKGNRVTGIWPGSAGHVTAVRREPRWEDWEYSYLGDKLDGKVNRFQFFFGSGWTSKEAEEGSDMTGYLKLQAHPAFEGTTGKQVKGGGVDVRDLHEQWWDLPGYRG